MPPVIAGEKSLARRGLRSLGDPYLVKCDDQKTTTQADIDAGVANILIGFAPLRVTEFVVTNVPQAA